MEGLWRRSKLGKILSIYLSQILESKEVIKYYVDYNLALLRHSISKINKTKNQPKMRLLNKL